MRNRGTHHAYRCCDTYLLPLTEILRAVAYDHDDGRDRRILCMDVGKGAPVDDSLGAVDDIDRCDDLGDWTRPLLKLIVLSRNNAPADRILREADVLRDCAASNPITIAAAIVRVADAAVMLALTRSPGDRLEVGAAVSDVLRLHAENTGELT